MSLLGYAVLHRSTSRVIIRQRKQIGHTAPIGHPLSGLRWNTTTTTSSSSGTTSSENSNNAPQDRKQTRLPLTLYRQLLQWCRTTEAGIPLEAFIEPISLAPPEMDADTLRALKQYHDTHNNKDTITNREATATSTLMLMISNVSAMLPPKSRLESDSLNVRIQNSTDLRNLIRAMFRLNAQTNIDTTPEETRKTRISFAFQTLRCLNELSKCLDGLNRHRKDHMDRGEAVQYHVGQVVQHKHERWRGVVVGWEEPDGDPNNNKMDKDGKSVPTRLTSLTTKKYTASEFLTSVRYEVVLDLGDVHMMQASSSFIVATQDDLELVTDPSLCRIRSSRISDHFKRFDSRSNLFMSNDMLAYEFPADHKMQQQASEAAGKDNTSETPVVSPDDIAKKVTSEIKGFAKHLEALTVFPDDSSGDNENLKLLAAIRAKIASACSDHMETWPASVLIPRYHGMAMEAEDYKSPIASASARLRQLLNIALEVRDILWHRQTSQEVASELKFGIGDVVYHNGFGFRGVVVAFDHQPTVDVSRWDGLVDIEDPLEKPFYHVIPDQQDCIDVFGSERGMRYVCEDNLESCSSDRRALTVSLDADWTRIVCPEGTTVFLPPSHIKMKHGMDIGDNGVTEASLSKVQEAMSQWLVASRDLTDGDAKFCLSLSDLFELLKATERMEDAIALEETIKEIWKAHPSGDLRRKLDEGIANVLRGKSEDALETFRALTEEDSHYAEAWNKIAACEYLLGNMSSSLDAAKKAVDLMPLHFQAHNGVGLCEYDQGNYTKAADSFRKSLELDPWSPVSSKLAPCIDMLNRETETAPTGSDES